MNDLFYSISKKYFPNFNYYDRTQGFKIWYSSQRRGSGRRPEPSKRSDFRKNGHKNSWHIFPKSAIFSVIWPLMIFPFLIISRLSRFAVDYQSTLSDNKAIRLSQIVQYLHHLTSHANFRKNGHENSCHIFPKTAIFSFIWPLMIFPFLIISRLSRFAVDCQSTLSDNKAIRLSQIVQYFTSSDLSWFSPFLL